MSTRPPSGRRAGWRGVLCVLVVGIALFLPALAVGQEPEGWALHIDYLRSLIEREPSLPSHYLRLAQAYARVGDEAQTFASIDEVVNHGGNVLTTEIVLGDLYVRQKRFAEAINHYLTVLTESPSQPYVLTQVWTLVQKTRRQRGSPLGLERAILIDILNAQGFYVSPSTDRIDKTRCEQELERGHGLVAAGDIRGATLSYERAAGYDPWNPRVYRSLGIAYARDSRLDEANGAYTLYTVLAPSDADDLPTVRRVIADFYRKRAQGAQPNPDGAAR